MHILWIMMGASLGALCRYALYAQLGTWGWPLSATCLVNILGCFCAGFFVHLALDWSQPFHEVARLFLIIGFLGSFTTFSAFSLDLLELSRQHLWGPIAVHILLNVSGSWIAVFVGSFLGVQWVSRTIPL